MAKGKGGDKKAELLRQVRVYPIYIFTLSSPKPLFKLLEHPANSALETTGLLL